MKTSKRAAGFLTALLFILSLLPAGALAGGEPEAASGEALVSSDYSGEPVPTEESRLSEAGEASEDMEQAAPEEADPILDESDAPALDGDTYPSNLYVVQSQRGWCTLASATMMLKARMYLSGNDLWSSITQEGVYSSAWLYGAGLYFNWSYSIGGNRITVSHATVNGISVNALKSLLDAHPEGIVLYVYDVPHAIFVTDYVGDTFYGSDPANSAGMGRKPIANTWLGSQCGGTQSGILSCADAYWYVSGYSISSTTRYTLRFDANGGSVSETSRTVRGGYAVGELPTPTRTGYVFAGWYTGQYDGKEITESSSIVGDTTLYAHWYAVYGTIAFSASPAAIRLYQGESSVSVTVSGEGSLNSVTMAFELEESAGDALSASWDGSGDKTSRTVVFTAEPSASGAYHAVFYMYDADTGALLNRQTLTINVISDDLYLTLYRTEIVFAAGSDEAESVDIFYGGTEGDLPEGYELTCECDLPDAVLCGLDDFNGYARPLSIRNLASYPCTATITLRLHDPSGWVCSEAVVTVRVYETSGVCGGDYIGNVAWVFDGGTLRISVIDPGSDEGGDMWNYETVYGRAPWYPWADEITRVEIASGVGRIGSCAFYGCGALRYISIADTCTEIGEKAFWNCTSLTSLSIPGSVTFVAADAFHNCSQLAEIEFHEGTSRLSAGALDGCAALNTLYIPASMTDLQLSYGSPLRDIYYGGAQNQWDNLDASCSVKEKLPAGTQVHVLRALSPGDASVVLASDGVYYAAYDLNGDSEISPMDAALLLQLLVS